MAQHKALFLDRDGVICEILDPASENHGYLTSWDEFKLLDGIAELIDVAHAKGYLVFVVTNQPHVAKGLITEQKLLEIHAKMQVLLENRFDKIYYCPHVNEDNCECRKPKAGMLLAAQKEFDIDFASSLMVGDGDWDIHTGQSVGCKTVFVKNKYKEQYLKNCSPDYVVDTPRDIINFI